MRREQLGVGVRIVTSDSDDDQEYEVDRIVRHHPEGAISSTTVFQVRYVDFTDEGNRWFLAQDLPGCQDKLDQYMFGKKRV